jgi:putative phosphoesterase
VRIGLLSDPHANVVALRAALAGLRDAGAEEIVCAGDVVGYHTAVNETIDELRRSGAHVVLGNHDAMLLGLLPVDLDRRAEYGLDYAARVITPENRSWLAELPETVELQFGELTLKAFHGSPWQPLTEYVYPDNADFDRFASVDADVVVLGHTHWPLRRQVGSCLVVNPGSCGLPRDGKGGAPFAVVDTVAREVVLKRAPYDESVVTSRFLDALRDP